LPSMLNFDRIMAPGLSGFGGSSCFGAGPFVPLPPRSACLAPASLMRRPWPSVRGTDDSGRLRDGGTVPGSWRGRVSPIASVVAVSPTTHRTIPPSTFPNWYFMLHCLPQNKESLVLSAGKCSTSWARGKSSSKVCRPNDRLASQKFNRDYSREILGGRYGIVIEAFARC